jgi:hypothetical protein
VINQDTLDEQFVFGIAGIQALCHVGIADGA